jgi:oleate hydratase
MNPSIKAYLIGGGIGSLAAAAFMIRDGGMQGKNITILESSILMGGSMDGSGDPERGYLLRGGRMLATDNYECTWDLFKSIPSIENEGKSVFEETEDFNNHHHSFCMARLIDRHRAKLDGTSMGFSMQDRMELLKLSHAHEKDIGTSCITDWFSPGFFTTEFWFMWVTTFSFQPWHSAAEFKRYLHRFLLEFTRIETLAGIKRTIYNQYDSLILPLKTWLTDNGVRMINACTVTDLDHTTLNEKFSVTHIHCLRHDTVEVIPLNDGDLVFLQNGSMTDASSLGSMISAPAKLTKADSTSWHLWESLAEGRPEFGNPAMFNQCIAQSCWESFTVTLKDPRFFRLMHDFTGNAAGTGGLVTFKDSNWLMSIALPHQPHFSAQPKEVQVFWGYALFPDRIGNFVAKPMEECNGAELLKELSGHLRLDQEVFDTANCIPCRMPYVTSMFMPRNQHDRPLPVPKNSKNLAFVSQFVEIENDVVFTVEYSIRAAQIAVYELLGITREIPPITSHDKSLRVQFEALIKAFK